MLKLLINSYDGLIFVFQWKGSKSDANKRHQMDVLHASLDMWCVCVYVQEGSTDLNFGRYFCLWRSLKEEKS